MKPFLGKLQFTPDSLQQTTAGFHLLQEGTGCHSNLLCSLCNSLCNIYVFSKNFFTPFFSPLYAIFTPFFVIEYNIL